MVGSGVIYGILHDSRCCIKSLWLCELNRTLTVLKPNVLMKNLIGTNLKHFCHKPFRIYSIIYLVGPI